MKEIALHDRMVAVLFDVWQNPGPGPVFFPEPMTEAILAMPEMQAIRRLLWVLRSDAVCHEDDGHYYTDSHDEWHKLEKALPHVAAWVRSDP